MEEHLFIQTENLSLTQVDFLIRLVMTTGIGFVIGLEREHHAMEEEKELFGGVRTFILIVLTGFLATLFGELLSYWITVTTLAGFLLISSFAYWGKQQRGHVGATTLIAGILAFTLGGIVLLGFFEAALPVMVIMVLTLSLKVRLHRLIDALSNEELFAFLIFVSITALLLPFLPDTQLGPYDAVNPYEIGWVIVLVSGLSFTAYMLVKFLGANRGLILTGIIGGLLSSTAVAWVFSKKSEKSDQLAVGSAIAILAASTLMVPRVLVWVYIFDRSLLSPLLLPFFLIVVAGAGIAYFFYRRYRPEVKNGTELPLDNPLRLQDALLFGFFYVGITLLVKFSDDKLGSSGTYLTSIVAALPNIDAITISMAKLGGTSISKQVAQNAILLAALSNTVVKLVISLWFGSATMRRYVLIGFGLLFAAGLGGFGILNLL
jgi:uncharacterized membrane protein (DUF4010 family)